MNIVPIAFAFDNNLILPACVCISSLMMHARKDTFYDIFILHSEKSRLNKEKLNCIPKTYPNCKINYRIVDNTFDKSFEVRGVTTATYYRLLIPELIPEYDKIIYSDVDIIFRMDLSDLYKKDISNFDIAATRDWGLNYTKEGEKYISSELKLEIGNYLQAGFIMLNSAKLRADNKIEIFRNEATKKYKYQDQDILNVVCCKSIYFLPPMYNMTDYSFFFMRQSPTHLPDNISAKEAIIAQKEGNLHFNGHKPWKKFSVNFDIWWEYYRKSPFFDDDFYFNFYYDRLNLLDQLSLWKRIKILVRYFVYGIRKV